MSLEKKVASLKEDSAIMIKVALVGDAQVGKTTLMVKYCENRLDEDYIQTLGVNFMEKTVTLRSSEITFSIWDLGGHHEFLNMLPLVCNDAAAILFMFDLSRVSTLNSIKEWYRQARAFNRNGHALLVGTKYDVFSTFAPDEQRDIEKQARKYAKAMKAPLLFTSAHQSINVQKCLKLLSLEFLKSIALFERITEEGKPLLIFGCKKLK